MIRLSWTRACPCRQCAAWVCASQTTKFRPGLAFLWPAIYLALNILLHVGAYYQPVPRVSRLSLSGVRSFIRLWLSIVTGSWLAAPAPLSLSVTRIPVTSCQNISQAAVKSSHDTQPTLIMYTDLNIILTEFKVIDIQFRHNCGSRWDEVAVQSFQNGY